MRLRTRIAAVLGLIVLASLAYSQRRFNPFYGEDDEGPAVTSADAAEKTEFVFTRLRYPSWGRPPSSWWAMRGNWTIDFPKADRHFVQGLRRLSRVNTRMVEHVTDLESDEVYNWPWLYVVEPGHWELTDAQCKKLRDYLLRGGFMMTDDFHGTMEWEIFIRSMNRVFPDRPIVDVEDSDPIFHTIWHLDERFQVPGVVTFGSGVTYEADGVEPKWRGIYDDKGRLMVAICHNMDLGDAWEHSDSPHYPERYASLAYRIGINYIIYAMTH